MLGSNQSGTFDVFGMFWDVGSGSDPFHVRRNKTTTNRYFEYWDDENWSLYDKYVQSLLEDAERIGHASTSFMIGSHVYSINFGQDMYQLNLGTGKNRPVRRNGYVLHETLPSPISVVDHPHLPPYVKCPITQEPMQVPMVASDGHSYEFAAISKWMKSSTKSPVTGAVLKSNVLFVNHNLRMFISGIMTEISGESGESDESSSKKKRSCDAASGGKKKMRVPGR